jgi:nucleoside-diphosphate-sugar epimerase
MPKHLFVTGASGFVGKETVRKILAARDDFSCSLLVRTAESAEAAAQNLSALERNRIRFVPGDLVMGDYAVPSGTDMVVHLAASTSFEQEKRAEITAVNLEGTRTLVKKAKKAGVPSFVYMGTAYAAGHETGLIPEGFFDRPPAFKNPYEESKYDAELLIRSARFEQETIIRPSIIMGDSKSFDSHGDNRGFYGYIYSLFRVARAHLGGDHKFWKYWSGAENCANRMDLNVRLAGHDDVKKNIVTIDYVVDATERILTDERYLGRTYNLVNNYIAVREAADAIEDGLRVTGFKYVPSLALEEINKGNRAEVKAFQTTRLYHPYTIKSDPNWETTNAARLGIEPTPMTLELFRELTKGKISEFRSFALSGDSTGRTGRKST